MSLRDFFHRIGGPSWRLRLSVAVLFAVGLFLSLTAWDRMALFRDLPILAEILKEMGKAFTIAAVLAAFVESAQKLKFLNEFIEHISIHIMGRKLPQKLRNHVEWYLGAKFVRPKLWVTYQIETCPGSPERVKLSKKVRYTLENCFEDDDDYDWQYRIDDPWFSDEFSTIDRVGQLNPGTGGDFKYWRDEELAKKIASEIGGQRFHESVRIPGTASHDKESAPMYLFMAESTECVPSWHEEHFTATHPVLWTMVTVKYNHDEFRVSVHLPLEKRDVAFEHPDGKDIEGGKYWVIKQPILPGWSFFTTWRKIAPSAPAPTPRGGVTPP